MIPTIKTWLYALPLGLIILPIIANAELYKWTDANGAVHYSDAKPKNGSVTSPQITLNQIPASDTGNTSIPQVLIKKPLKNNTGNPAKSLQLERVMIDMADSASDRKVIGADYYGANCLKKYQDLVVVSGRNQLDKLNVEKKIQEIFLAQNLNYIGKRDVIFQGQQAESADLSLAAIITDIKMHICQQGDKRLKAKVETYIKVEWQLFDPLSRRILNKTQTEGYDNNTYDNIADSAGISGQNKAFTNALLNLLADSNFVQHLLSSETLPAVSTDNTQHLKILSQSANRNARFIDTADALQKSVVTIRTTMGHGTGFYVSRDGYILTNAHVVNEAQTVLVVTKERQFKADVIRKNPQRDIALLKPRETVNVAALAISTQPTKLGETIFVIGTPLDEKLEHTITSGIVSASRKNDDGQSYFQTDAALNPGNSGGPAFNQSGQVMGIAVSALLGKGGLNQSINFLIPIDDALNKLNIGYQ